MQTNMQNQKGSFVPANEVMIRQAFDKIIVNDNAVPVEDCNHDTIIKIRSRKMVVGFVGAQAIDRYEEYGNGWCCARCGMTIDKISDWKNHTIGL